MTSGFLYLAQSCDSRKQTVSVLAHITTRSLDLLKHVQSGAHYNKGPCQTWHNSRRPSVAYIEDY